MVRAVPQPFTIFAPVVNTKNAGLLRPAEEQTMEGCFSVNSSHRFSYTLKLADARQTGGTFRTNQSPHTRKAATDEFPPEIKTLHEQAQSSHSNPQSHRKKSSAVEEDQRKQSVPDAPFTTYSLIKQASEAAKDKHGQESDAGAGSKQTAA